MKNTLCVLGVLCGFGWLLTFVASRDYITMSSRRSL